MNPIGLQLRAALTFCAQTSVTWRNRVIQALTSINRPLQSPFYRLAVVISRIFNTSNVHPNLVVSVQTAPVVSVQTAPPILVDSNQLPSNTASNPQNRREGALPLVGFQNRENIHCDTNSFAIALFHTAPHVDIPSDDQDDELQQLHQKLETTHASLQDVQQDLSALQTDIASQIGEQWRQKKEIQTDITQTWEKYRCASITENEREENLTPYYDELSKWKKLELNQERAKRYQTLIEEYKKTIKTTIEEIKDRKQSLILAREALSVLRGGRVMNLTSTHASAFSDCHPNHNELHKIKVLYEGKPPEVRQDLQKNNGRATILRAALDNPNWRVIRLGGNGHWQALVRNVNNNTVTLVNDNRIKPNYMTIDAIYAKWSKAETWEESQLTFYSKLD